MITVATRTPVPTRRESNLVTRKPDKVRRMIQFAQSIPTGSGSYAEIQGNTGPIVEF
jgi:hypothetical protein